MPADSLPLTRIKAGNRLPAVFKHSNERGAP